MTETLILRHAAKPWYTSKTIWLNIGFALVTLANEFARLVNVVENEDLSETIRLITTMCLIFGNVIMRFLTEMPVKVKK